MTSTHSSAPRAFVFGSCVTRDTLELVDRNTLAIESYIARQSLLSAGSDASAHLPPGDLDVGEGFKLRMIQKDFAGSLRTDLASSAPEIDVLLWDLADERHGVHRFSDGTFVTRSIDNIQVPRILEVLDATEHLPLGSPEHLALWEPAAVSFTAFLADVGLLERTVVLQVPWALHTTQGRSTPWSMGMRARDANRLYEPYYEILRGLGHTMIQIPSELVIADPNHKWGLAPFHYVEEVYQEVLNRLRTSGVIRLRPTPPAGAATSAPGTQARTGQGKDAGKHAAQKQAARKHAAQKQAARKHAAQKQAARKQATQKQAAQKQAARKQAAQKQAARKQATQKQAARKHAAQKQAARKQATQQADPTRSREERAARADPRVERSDAD